MDSSSRLTVIIVSHSMSRGGGRIEQIPLRASATYNYIDNEIDTDEDDDDDLLLRDLVRDVSIQELHHNLRNISINKVILEDKSS